MTNDAGTLVPSNLQLVRLKNKKSTSTNDEGALALSNLHNLN